MILFVLTDQFLSIQLKGVKYHVSESETVGVAQP